MESDGEALTGLRFGKGEACVTSSAPDKTADNTPIIAQTLSWLDDYFAGKTLRHVPRLNPQGTEFQKRVWHALLTVGYGQTKTYGEIAKMVGCRSAQAVGQAVGRNPIALIIPCHRVIAANGKSGGYAYGVEIKKQLLALEKR